MFTAQQVATFFYTVTPRPTTEALTMSDVVKALKELDSSGKVVIDVIPFYEKNRLVGALFHIANS